VCHLVEALNPGTFPAGGLNDLKNRSPLDNATKGEGLAESDLGIPQILAPEDMVAAADELSCMTYISYFRDYENNEGKRRAGELAAKTADPTKTRAWGPGLEAAQTYTPTEFYIQAVNAAGVNIPIGGENFKVTISGPSGTQNPKVVDNGNGTYQVNYELSEPGMHKIEVELKTQRGNGPWAHIQGSPFSVNCLSTADPDQCCIEAVHATVRAKTKRGANMTRGGENFAFTVSERQQEIQAKLKDNGDGSYSLAWMPPKRGNVTFNVTVNNKSIQGTPWTERHPQ